jgi:hypothetical protein
MGKVFPPMRVSNVKSESLCDAGMLVVGLPMVVLMTHLSISATRK